jgi:hypothetical protein
MMTKTEITLVVAGFILAGLCTWWTIERSSNNAVHDCETKCQAEGKKAIQAPTGTAGSSIEGGRSRIDTSLDCHCISNAVEKNKSGN